MFNDLSLKSSLRKQDPKFSFPNLQKRKLRSLLIYMYKVTYQPTIKAYLQSVKYTYAALYLLDDLVMKSSISPSTDLSG